MTVKGYEIKPNSDLAYSNLSNSNLNYSNLSHSDLRYSDLSSSNLNHSDLSNANLKGAAMEGCNLYGALLPKGEKHRKGEKLKENIIGYKKCFDRHYDTLIVELIIPRGAIVFSINGDKCRTDKVIVKDIYDLDGNHYKRAYSSYKVFSYYVGDEIEVFNFNCEYNIECAEGIHFFKTKEEAINW